VRLEEVIRNLNTLRFRLTRLNALGVDEFQGNLFINLIFFHKKENTGIGF